MASTTSRASVFRSFRTSKASKRPRLKAVVVYIVAGILLIEIDFPIRCNPAVSEVIFERRDSRHRGIDKLSATRDVPIAARHTAIIDLQKKNSIRWTAKRSC